jgi:hypothetical protein
VTRRVVGKRRRVAALQIRALAKIKIPFALFAIFRSNFVLVAERRWKLASYEVAGVHG